MSEDKQPDFDFMVDGTPAPGGSKTFFPVWKKDGTLVWTWKNKRQWPVIRVVDDAGEKNKEWRNTVAWQARAALPTGWPATDRPLLLRLNFWLRRPKGHYGTGRNAEILKPDSPKYPGVKPDALKLARSTEDALTGIVWVDDAQVISGVQTKQYAGIGDRTGCRIRITLL